MIHKKIFAPFIFNILISVCLSVCITRILFVLGAFETTRNSESGTDKTNIQSTYSHTEYESLVIGAVDKANPAVVAITISKNVPTYEQYYQNSPNPFGGFFGNPFEQFFNFSVPQLRQNGTEKKEIGGGSGFLVSEDGYIVTNKHVVQDEEAEYAVFLNDGAKYDAQVIARDPMLDIAVIKIEGKNFTHLSFANSDNIKLGQSVIAIGNALAEFRNTVSTGIVAGISRSITASDGRGSSEVLDQLIQTDAAINPGNSGGPLLNLQGEVIGVNVAVASGAENVGFALSSNSVKNIIESVKETGKIVRPFIGIRYVPITTDIAKKNNLDIDYGILVQRGTEVADLAVIPGSPADKAGIVENDIITHVDGKKLTEDVHLASIILTKKAGDTIELTVLHKGDEKKVSVKLDMMK